MAIPASVFADATQDRRFVQTQGDQWAQRLQVCSSPQIALDADSKNRLSESAALLVRRYRAALMSHRQLQSDVNQMIDLNRSALQTATVSKIGYIVSGASAAAAATIAVTSAVAGASAGAAGSGGGAALPTRAALEVAERVGLGRAAAPAAAEGGEILGILTLGAVGTGVGAMTNPGQAVIETTVQGGRETWDFVSSAFRESLSSQSAITERSQGAASRAQDSVRELSTDAFAQSDVLSAQLTNLTSGGLNHVSRDLMTQLEQFDHQMRAARSAVVRQNAEAMRELKRQREARTWVGSVLHKGSDDSAEVSETMAYIMAQEELAFREVRTLGQVLSRMEAVCGSLARPDASRITDTRVVNRRVAFIPAEAISDEQGLKPASAPAPAETAPLATSPDASGAR